MATNGEKDEKEKEDDDFDTPGQEDWEVNLREFITAACVFTFLLLYWFHL